jgi:RNA polymerase sigma-70 factor, ECF subfamily
MTERQQLLTALHDAHAEALWRYVVSLTHDHAFAEDVVQETLVRAWKHPEVLEQQGSPRGWLYRVARNLVLDEWRTARARNEWPTDEVPERAGRDETSRTLDAMLVNDALGDLTPDHRRVIVLAHLAGRSIAEIAAELDVAPGTVKSRLHYGMRALKLALQERGVSAP